MCLYYEMHFLACFFLQNLTFTINIRGSGDALSRRIKSKGSLATVSDVETHAMLLGLLRVITTIADQSVEVTVTLHDN